MEEEEEASARKCKSKKRQARFSYKVAKISINIFGGEHSQFMQIARTANPSMLCLANEPRIGPGSASIQLDSHGPIKSGLR